MGNRLRVRKTVTYTVSVVVGLGLLGGVLYWVGIGGILAQLSALGVVGILAVFANVVLSMMAYVLSWWIILRIYGVDLPLPTVIASRLGGYAVSYLTPTLYFGGEPVRAIMAMKRTSATGPRVIATIVVERFLGGIAVLVFLIIGTFSVALHPEIEASSRRGVFAGMAFISFWLLIGLVNFAWNFKWVSRAIRWLKHPIPRWKVGLDRAANKVSETEDEIANAFSHHWRGTVLAFLIQLVVTFLVFLRPLIFFYFSSQLIFTPGQLWILFVFNLMLSFLLWITPGGLGTSEAAMIGIFSLVGVGKQGAVAYSLIFKAVEFLFVAVGIMGVVRLGLSQVGSKRTRARVASGESEREHGLDD
ncbi:flippase-like domain-containing protein [Candidatus Bipolaricaulota bacterium]|nr:flippase-like domain-containing protein [Candidatus Bipolaricaulota bacterium]